MRVLIIGAGSVGQVYGYHLQKGGAKVTYLVKEKHLPGLSEGMVLYPWNRKDRSTPIRWTDFELVTSLDEGLVDGIDVIALATSATALIQGSWYDEVVQKRGDASILVLQPGTDIPEWIYERTPREAVVWGLISVSAWPAPLPGQDLPESGQAWWFPWGGKLGFSGPESRAQALVDAMSAGGAPSALRDDIHVDQAFAGPMLAFVVIALELSDWSMDRLTADRPLLAQAHQAMHACLVYASKATNKPIPFLLRQLGPGRIRLVLKYILPLAPVHFETFFRVHYTKISDQTPVLLNQRIAAIERHDLSAQPLIVLRDKLMAKRAQAAT
ncbi:MAG: ketopantoate reductase family protein [Myxococcota bacterium]